MRTRLASLFFSKPSCCALSSSLSLAVISTLSGEESLFVFVRVTVVAAAEWEASRPLRDTEGDVDRTLSLRFCEGVLSSLEPELPLEFTTTLGPAGRGTMGRAT